MFLIIAENDVNLQREKLPENLWKIKYLKKLILQPTHCRRTSTNVVCSDIAILQTLTFLLSVFWNLCSTTVIWQWQTLLTPCCAMLVFPTANCWACASTIAAV
jgi:hypothetical protein